MLNGCLLNDVIIGHMLLGMTYLYSNILLHWVCTVVFNKFVRSVTLVLKPGIEIERWRVESGWLYRKFRDAKSWFEACAVVNDWGNKKKLIRLPTLLAWAILDSLPDASTGTYAHLKEVLLSRLRPDTEEDRQRACDELGQRKLHENQERVDELARDIKKLFDMAHQKPIVRWNCISLRTTRQA